MPALGTVQTILICHPTGTVDNAACPAGTKLMPVYSYVLDQSSAGYIDATSAPVDYEAAASVWGFFFVTTLGIYLFAWACGMVAAPFMERYRRS